MQLKSTRLLLEELCPEDAAAIHELHSIPQVDRFNTLGIPSSFEVTEKLLATWLKLQAEAPRQSYILKITEADTNSFAGLIALSLGKPNFRMAEVWYKLHPNFWGKGYATEALRQFLSFGFNGLQLHRVEAGCAVENLASVRVLEKAKMQKEGCKRKVLPIRGEWVSNFEYAILEEDFFAK